VLKTVSTACAVIRLIAPLGGILGRKGDREQGAKIIWRSMKDIAVFICRGFELMGWIVYNEIDWTCKQQLKSWRPHQPRRLRQSPFVMVLHKITMIFNRWTKEQIKLAFHLYCQLPFGKLHSRNSEIIELAKLIGRTPSAVAMKLVNFASLDPLITETGRSGLGNASALDREIWREVHTDWEVLALECEQLRIQLGATPELVKTEEETSERLPIFDDFTGETRRVVTEQRIKQNFFRRAVLSSYRNRCCMSGLSETRLLIASHIVPWSKDKKNRLNPSNGLCLSAIHDRAFDKGFISITDDWTVVVCKELQKRDDPFVKQVLLPLHGKKIELPERFQPDHAFLIRHREEIFLDSCSK
jgi:hypothetical protein